MNSTERNKSSSLTLFLAGDVMTGRGIDQAFAESADPQLYESYVKDARFYYTLAQQKNGRIPRPLEYTYIWGEAFKWWEHFNPAYRLINLETSITDHHKPWPTKGIHYKMHPANTNTLKAAKIDFCSLANNHVLDWKIPGLIETLGSLEKMDISYAGAGRDESSAGKPAIFTTSKGRLLIFAYGHKSSGIPAKWESDDGRAGINFLAELDAERVHQDILHYKKANDIVVLSIHWGGNWGYDIPAEQKKFARELIDRGAVDIIHGHSSHHPQGMEVYQNKLILYGAGDLINDYEGITGHESYRGELSLMYFPELDLETGDLLSLSMTPMEIRKLRLNQASQQDAEWMQKTLDRECRTLGGEVRLKDGVLRLIWK